MKRIIAGSFLIAAIACRSNDPAPVTQTTDGPAAAPSAAAIETTHATHATEATHTHTEAAPASATSSPAAAAPAAANPEEELMKASRISVAEVKKMVDAGDAVIVDVRPASAFAEGHIAGAINIPLSDFQQRMGELPKNKYLATYCT